jgi:threonine dehydrogenase-like Zn-dependent dehydrogenase
MRAVRCEGRDVRVVELPPTSGPGVRVRVKAAGVCGSDLHLLGSVQGITLGHEIAGITDDGTPVAVEPMSPCGHCGPCRAGDCNLCLEGVRMFHGVGLDGGMADEMRVPARALVPLPAGLPLRDASLVEPLAVVVYALRRARLRATQRVVVIGGGTIGLCAVAAARAAGAEVAGRAPTRSARRGAPGSDAGERQYTWSSRPRAASALAQAIELAKPGGTVSIPASTGRRSSSPRCRCACARSRQPAISTRAARSGATSMSPRPALRHARAAAALITTAPLDAAAKAFATAASRSAGAIKVVLEP